MTAFDEMVAQLVGFGFPRATVEAQVRSQHPELAPAPADVTKNAAILEDKEQGEIYKQFRAYRFKVWNLSQARAAKQSPGLGDGFVAHRDRPIAFWWESKRQVDGELSPDQIEFRDDCLRCNVPYHSGDRYDAAALLVRLGLAVYGPGPNGIEPIPLAGSGPSLPDMDRPEEDDVGRGERSPARSRAATSRRPDRRR